MQDVQKAEPWIQTQGCPHPVCLQPASSLKVVLITFTLPSHRSLRKGTKARFDVSDALSPISLPCSTCLSGKKIIPERLWQPAFPGILQADTRHHHGTTTSRVLSKGGKAFQRAKGVCGRACVVQDIHPLRRRGRDESDVSPDSLSAAV